jgi:hypothetical protein
MNATINYLRNIETAAIAYGEGMADIRVLKDSMNRAYCIARIDGQVEKESATDTLRKGIRTGLANNAGRSAILTDKEESQVTTAIYQANQVCTYWKWLPAADQTKFRNGNLKVSTAATKAKAASDADAEAKRKAAAGPAPVNLGAPSEPAPAGEPAADTGAPKGQDGKPRKERDESKGAVARAMLDIATILSNGLEMSAAEAEAYTALKAAIAAFDAAAVPEAKTGTNG